MKHLSLCENCNLQFDVTDLRPGSKFRCHCGSVLLVKQLKTHTSASIHCSGCGGTRKTNEDTCVYCSAQFTIHEKDLTGSCPQCLTRTSAKAAYCHACGLVLTEGLPAGTPTRHLCPACQLPEYPMNTRTYPKHGVALLECVTCAGVWVSRKTFDHLCRTTFKSSFQNMSLIKATTNEGPQKRYYRVCPVCQEVLNRVLYKKHSGVVVDVCHQDGIWFDVRELETVLAYEKDTNINRAGLDDQMGEESNSTTEPASQEDSGSQAVYLIEEDVDLDSLVKTFFTR